MIRQKDSLTVRQTDLCEKNESRQEMNKLTLLEVITCLHIIVNVWINIGEKLWQ